MLPKAILFSYLLLFSILCVSLYPYAVKYFEETPYKNVEQRYLVWEEDSVKVGYTFTKTDCTLKTFAVVGFSGGIPRYLPVVDLDGLEDNFNREEGEHGLNIRILFEGAYYEKIELRTRHECHDGDKTEVVQRVFATIFNENL